MSGPALSFVVLLPVADVLSSTSVDDFNLREYTSAIDRLVREIDRLGKNERRSTEARIKDYVRFSSGVYPKRTLYSACLDLC